MPELETQVEPTQQATDPTPQTEPIRGTDQDAARRALYEKHYGTPPPGDTTPADEPVAATSGSTALVEPTPTPETPVVAQLPPEFLQLLQNQADQLKAMQTQIAALKPPAPQVDTTHEPEPSWIAALREGRVADAERLLVESVAAKVQQPTTEAASVAAAERLRAEFEINSFVNEVRAANPELVPMEDLVAMRAGAAFNALKAAGKITSTEDTVREYKKCVLDATESVRKIALGFRGQGKSEAAVRNREVLSVSTPSPQQTSVRTGDQINPKPGDDNRSDAERTSDYMEQRRQQAARGRGFGMGQ